MNYHEEEILGKAFDSRLMKRLLRFLWPFKWIALFSFGLLVIVSAAELAGPYILKIAIDTKLIAGDYPGLLQLVLLYIAVILVQSIKKRRFGGKSTN